MKKNTKPMLLALSGGLIIALYNVILFVAAGFVGHGAAFWLSYAFMMLTCATAAVALMLFFKSNKQEIDLILSFPVIKRTAVCIIAEFIVSTLFIILDCVKVNVPWAIPFILQIALIVVYVVLVVSCFLSKEVVVENEERVKQKTFTFKMLYIDAQALSDTCTDEATKKAFAQLAEDIRYSDPVSNDYLVPLEQEIQSCIINAKLLVAEGNNEEAIKLCSKATLLLNERNMKCKALK